MNADGPRERFSRSPHPRRRPGSENRRGPRALRPHAERDLAAVPRLAPRSSETVVAPDSSLAAFRKISLPATSRGQLGERDSAIAALAVDQARPDSPDLVVLTRWRERLKGAARASRESPGRSSPSRQIGIQPERGCHRGVTRLYPPLARKRDRDRRAGTARLLLSSAGFVSFRAPIDSVMDPGGQPRRPTDPFLSLRCGFGPLRGWKTRRLTQDRCFNRSAAPH